jgi:hypothetical protein
MITREWEVYGLIARMILKLSREDRFRVEL